MNAQRRSRIEVEARGEVIIITLTNKKILNEQVIEFIGEQLYNLIVDSCQMVLVLVDVELMSGAFLGKLVTLNRKVQDAHGRLVLCHVHPTIFEAFYIVKLPRIIDVCKNRETALAYLASNDHRLLLGR